MATIQGVQGYQYPRVDANGFQKQAYENNNYQYATSSHAFDHDMHPALIVQPKGDDDIVTAVKYAKANGLALAIKSGGHQYSGASSTSGQNILLDLKLTYLDPKEDIKVITPTPIPGKAFVRASVSWGMGSFNGFLKANKLFVPHGQCTDVRVGGHAQTGGYGQLGRSFGLLGDHIREIRLVDHNAEIRVIDNSSDPDLFNAILGGSPGNFGVITHYTIEVHRDEDHVFGNVTPLGMRGVWWYDEDTLKALLAKVAEIADNPDFPGNFDLCVTTLSSSFPMFDLWPELDGKMQEDHPEIYGWNGIAFWPQTIIVYAQWVPLTKDDKYDDFVKAWFQYFRDQDHKRLELEEMNFDKYTVPMSEMTGKWIFRNIREFEHPYVKRTYLTNSTTLGKDGWVDVVSDRINKVVSPSEWPSDLYRQCWMSSQIQPFGGKNSKFFTNRNNGTSYSWRDSTVVQVMDCFHESTYKDVAEQYQKENDALFNGPKSTFSKQDRRVLWGSYGDWDLSKSWQYYYESKEKYQALGKARQQADPNGTFTPNPFAVQRVK